MVTHVRRRASAPKMKEVGAYPRPARNPTVARPSERLPQNAEGPLYVDRSCIDCDTCRQIAPASFARANIEKSYVHHQPASDDEWVRATMALISCPTSSIGTVDHEQRRVLPLAAQALPERIAEDVHYCGYASESSFGASSYFLRREEGNVLVDSPRAAGPLMHALDELGGVRFMFLTHRDDVADHAKYHSRFGCDRILHHSDVTSGTRDVEVVLRGDAPTSLARDLLAIPVPGHTQGSMVLLYKDTFLFTGDHLWWSDERKRLVASRGVCWFSWEEQVRSLRRLLDYRFEWVLPGHGRRFHAAPAEMKTELERLVRYAESRA